MLDFSNIIVQPSPLQVINDDFFEQKKIKFYLKRDDLLHPQVSGNKWRKLKYNLLRMNELGLDTLVTFGGAYSNHIYSTAAAGKIFGFKTIGIIRGEELNKNSNPTLQFASSSGMELIFIDRKKYGEKEKWAQDFLQNNVGDYYVLPEGGTNEFALKGVEEMVEEINSGLGNDLKYIATAVGTGGTLAGICAANDPKSIPLGISVVGEKEAERVFLSIHNLLNANGINKLDFREIHGFSQGAYARTTEKLINFIKHFEQKHGILLEQIYTGKMLFALYQLIEKDYFPPNTTIVAVHTGGLQGRRLD